MKPESFEEQLKRQPLRSVPPEWRTTILNEVRRAEAPAPSPERTTTFSWERLLIWLRPTPWAWAGLAATWAVIAGIHWFSLPTIEAGDLGPISHSSHLQTPWRMSLWEQKQLQLELLESVPPAEPRPEKTRPQKPKPTTSRTAVQRAV